jgi:uncharacterized protein (TIGR02266 family)
MGKRTESRRVIRDSEGGGHKAGLTIRNHAHNMPKLEEERVEHERADRRYNRRVLIEVEGEGTTFSAHTRNISLGGVFIDTDHRLPFDSKVSMRFKVSTQSEPIEVEGHARWMEMDGGVVRGIGIQFAGLRARDVWALNKYFEKAE